MSKLPAIPAARPARPTTPRAGENGFKYRQQFGLVVTCTDEAHQQRLHARLTKMGLAPKVVCV